MIKRVLFSQPWPDDSVRHLGEYISRLEEKGCEVVLYPGKTSMDEADILQWLPGFYAHICGSEKWTANVMDQVTGIKIISRIGVGVDTVDIPAATAHGIAVTTTPGAGAETVSEFAMTLMLALSRNVMRNDRSIRAGKWMTITGNSIYRKTLGIVGFGLIGKQLAKRVKSFDMEVLAYDPVMDEKYAAENGVVYVSLEQLLKGSDYISLHLPLLNSTRNLIGEKELAIMKPTARIINTARGGIINEEALYHALKNGVICAAALDVFEKEPISPDNPLLTLDNVIFTPHMAGSSFKGLDSIVGAAVRNVIELIDGKLPRGIRNPEIFD